MQYKNKEIIKCNKNQYSFYQLIKKIKIPKVENKSKYSLTRYKVQFKNKDENKKEDNLK